MARLGSLVVLLVCFSAGLSLAERYLSDEDFEELYVDYLLQRENDTPQLRSDHHKYSKDASAASSMTIKMPGVSPQKHDSYMCTSLKMPKDTNYIVGIEPLAEMNTAHHMLMFGCTEPFSANSGETWNCGEMSPVCKSNQRIMYAWGRNAPKLALPKGVGFKAGGESDVKYLVLQVHYGKVDKFIGTGLKDYSGVVLRTTLARQRYAAGIYIVAGGWPAIPPHKEKAYIDASCGFISDVKIYPFAFRVHAHKLGEVITGYRVRDGKWTLIGKGDPQRPQAFYPIKKKLDISKYDELVARCTYNSMSRDTVTSLGATMKDEMCNFYFMYFYDQDKYPVDPPNSCASLGSEESSLFSHFPYGSDIPLPGGHPDMHMGAGHTMTRTIPSLSYNVAGDLLSNNPDLSQVKQICAVDLTPDDKQVVVLHRGDRSWDEQSFDRNEIFNPKFDKIQQDTLVFTDAVTGKLLKTWGKNKFYLPHGLTVDYEGNYWITDVGSHQVFKFGSTLDSSPLLVLGEALKPGSDNSHFCKPTDVAVDPSGVFYVSDGYCNQRILVYTKQGKLAGVITPSNSRGLPNPVSFSVPHSLALDSSNGILWVADRENRRVLQYDSHKLSFIKEFVSRPRSIYAVAFSKNGNDGVVHLVTYPDIGENQSEGFSYNANSAVKLAAWKPKQGFSRPHDLAVTKNSDRLYAVELNPPHVWHFKKTMSQK